MTGNAIRLSFDTKVTGTSCWPRILGPPDMKTGGCSCCAPRGRGQDRGRHLAVAITNAERHTLGGPGPWPGTGPDPR